MNKEINVLSKFDHPNIVKFLGIAYKDEIQYIIMELINGGDLKNYLVEQIEKRKTISQNKKIEILKKISLGMNELHSQNILHRDLASRNILVQIEGEEIIPKITDFGLSREQESYYQIQNSTIPTRWTSPEVFLYLKYYKESDVWSFGVVMWEVFENGKNPYFELQSSEVIEYVTKKKQILPKPEECSDEIYNEIMKPCFIFDFRDRPTFEKLNIKFERLGIEEYTTIPEFQSKLFDEKEEDTKEEKE